MCSFFVFLVYLCPSDILDRDLYHILGYLSLGVAYCLFVGAYWSCVFYLVSIKCIGLALGTLWFLQCGGFFLGNYIVKRLGKDDDYHGVTVFFGCVAAGSVIAAWVLMLVDCVTNSHLALPDPREHD